MTEPTLADITTCMCPVPIPEMPGHFKPCGQKFSSSGVSILGAKQSRLNQYMEGLAKHLAAKHPEVGLQMAQVGAAFMEMLFLRNFKTTDPELSEQQDLVRWQVHQQTLKARYPDRNLNEQAGTLVDTLIIETLRYCPTISEEKTVEGMRPVFQESIANAFRSIRDALEEPGKYPGVVPESAPAKVLV